MLDGIGQDIEEAAPPHPGGTGASTLETSAPRAIWQQAVKRRDQLVLLRPPTALAVRMDPLGRILLLLLLATSRFGLCAHGDLVGGIGHLRIDFPTAHAQLRRPLQQRLIRGYARSSLCVCGHLHRIAVGR